MMTDKERLTENAIAWAKERLGSPDCAVRGLSFIEDSLEKKQSH